MSTSKNVKRSERKLTRELENLRLPELQARYTEVTGKPTKTPNKKFLSRRIAETLAAKADVAGVLEAHGTDAAIAGQVDDDAADRVLEPMAGHSAQDDDEPNGGEAEALTQPKLTKLSVQELQQRYVEVIGRPTGSTSKAYLVWKLRQAEKGRIPIGPNHRRHAAGEAPEMKVLPLRLEADLVSELDAAWGRLGHRNRMDFLRRAMAVYLEKEGEHGVAKRLVDSPDGLGPRRLVQEQEPQDKVERMDVGVHGTQAVAG